MSVKCPVSGGAEGAVETVAAIVQPSGLDAAIDPSYREYKCAWCVVPSAVGFCVPWRISDAVASAQSGHARWVELELAVHPESPHRVGPAGRGVA